MRSLLFAGVSALAVMSSLWFAAGTAAEVESPLLQPQEVVLSVAAMVILLGISQAYLLFRSAFYAVGHEDSGRNWLRRRRSLLADSSSSDRRRVLVTRIAFWAFEYLLSSSLFVVALLLSGAVMAVTVLSATTDAVVSIDVDLLVGLIPLSVVVAASAVGRLFVAAALFPSPAVGRRVVALGSLPADPPSIRSLRNLRARKILKRLLDPTFIPIFALAAALAALPALGIDGVALGVLVTVAVGHLAVTTLRLFTSSRTWWRSLIRASGAGSGAPTAAFPRNTLPPTQRTLVEIVTPIGPNSPINELSGLLSDHRFLEAAPVRWTVVTDPERLEEVGEFLRSTFALHGAARALERVNVIASKFPKAGPKRTLGARGSTAPFVVFVDSDDRIDVSRLVAAVSAALSLPKALQAVHLFPFYLQTAEGLNLRKPRAHAYAPLVHHHCARLWPSGLFQSGAATYGSQDFEDAIFTLELADSLDHHRHLSAETAFLTYADHRQDAVRLTRAYKDSSHLMRSLSDRAIAEAERRIPPKSSPRERALVDVMVGRTAAEVAWSRGPMLDGLASNLDEFQRYRCYRPDSEIDEDQIASSIVGVRKRSNLDREAGIDRGLIKFILDELASRRPRTPMLRDANCLQRDADQQLGLFVGLMNAESAKLRTHETAPTVFYNLPGAEYALSRRAMSFFIRAPHFQLEVDGSLPVGVVEFSDPGSKSRSKLGSFELDRLMSSKLLRLWDRFYPTFNQVEQAHASVVLHSMAMRAEVSTVRLVATGPSSGASLDDHEGDNTVLTICCNSWVRQPDRMARMGAKILTAGDPIFHAGPSEYAQQFRADVVSWLRRDSEHLFVTVSRDIAIYLAEMPEDVHNQIIAPVFDAALDPNQSVPIETGRVQPYPNVMTLLMLPMAELFQPSEIQLFGFDGGLRGAEKYWDYDPEANYSDQLQQAVRAWHPEFFRVDYQGYRDDHDSHVESWTDRLAAQGITLRAAAPSNIPAVNAAFELGSIVGRSSQ